MAEKAEKPPVVVTITLTADPELASPGDMQYVLDGLHSAELEASKIVLSIPCESLEDAEVLEMRLEALFGDRPDSIEAKAKTVHDRTIERVRSVRRRTPMDKAGW